jgi:hypothetical protein
MSAGRPNSNTIIIELAAMRTLLLLTLIFALVLGIYEAKHAHAGEPTRCGFWGSIDAGMSCQ